MKTIFTADDFQLDFENLNLSLQENNSMLNDKKFTKFVFPIEIKIDDLLIHQLGDLLSDDFKANSSVNGFFEIEGKVHKAKLELQKIQEDILTCQIDYGFEDLPNFDKKLSELPLENFKVDDIYDFAFSRLNKKYPETNYQFPRIFSKKYSPDNKVWDAFDGYYNDLKPDGTAFRENYIDQVNEQIYNVNIMHPCPHPLYILKTGFFDAGLQLAGDIVTDDIFRNKWLFSGTEYFTSKMQQRFGFNFTSAHFESLSLVHGPDDFAFYDKEITIPKVGNYRINGIIGFWKATYLEADYKLLINGTVVWSRYHGRNNPPGSILETIPIDFNFTVTSPNTVVKLQIKTQFHEDSWTQNPMANLLITSDALEDIENSELGNESGVVINPNEINLTRAVPDMTFGEYVNAFTNWFNLDYDLEDNVVYMNRIQPLEAGSVVDFTFSEVADKSRILQNKKSFLLKFVDLDDDKKLDSMFYSATGEKINGKEEKDTTIIEINGYPLPVELAKPNGYTTAIVKKDANNIIQLLNYEGLVNNQNNCSFDDRIAFPKLFQLRWQRWLQQRLNSTEFNWNFLVPISQMAFFSMKNYIFCYKNYHIIKSWTKNKIDEEVYQVDITTESII